MKIGTDLDDVLREFMNPLLEFYYRKTGKFHSREEFKDFKWWPVWGITREEAIEIVNEFHEDYKIEQIKPLDGAISAINHLSSNGNDIHVITSGPIEFKYKSEEWINYYIKNSKIQVINAGDFFKHQGATKAEICNELNIKLFLEDSGETALDCARKGIEVILFDKPWNKQFNHENIYRVNNWQEALPRINYLSKNPKPQNSNNL